MSGANGRGIPTRDHPLRVPVKSGGVLLVRMARNSDQVRLQRIAGNDGSKHGELAFAQVLFLWAVVGAEGITDACSGERVEYRAETSKEYPSLGNAAAMSLFDAVTEEDVLAVYAAAVSGRLPEPDAEKSQGSPAVSAASAAS